MSVKYMPTGGIGKDNLASYLKLSCVFACGGSWMVKDELISGGRFDEITRLTADAVSCVKSALA
jgi:2-dehydro-3-deoxyphosphogluconate aldolase/(4S)-4-hydroxy-2-oxoglutarate aldolase